MMIHPASAGSERSFNQSSLYPTVRNSYTPTQPRDPSQLWTSRYHQNIRTGPQEPLATIHVPSAKPSFMLSKPRGSLSSCPIDSDDDDDFTMINDDESTATHHTWVHYVTVVILVIVWFIFTIILMVKAINEVNFHLVAVPENQVRSFYILEPTYKDIVLTLSGPFLPPFTNATPTTKWLTVWLERVQITNETNRYAVIQSNLSKLTQRDIVYVEAISSPPWLISLVPKELLDIVAQEKMLKSFGPLDMITIPRSLLRVQMYSSVDASIAVGMSYNLHPINASSGLLYAAAILFGMYALIIFELVHRTLAAVLASTMSVAVVAALNERPTMHELISWIDIETLLLLFSMMILVAILSETGIFDYLAVVAYRLTGGRVWHLIFTLCVFTASLSSVLDNVTTVLLMTPVTIRLCEVLKLYPVPVLLCMIIYSNIGGTLTPVGDPPNAIIASNPDIVKAGVDFLTFTLHMGTGVFVVFLVTAVQLRYIFRHITDPKATEPLEVQDLRHEITIWQRTASAMSSYTKNEVVVKEKIQKKERRLTTELKQRIKSASVVVNDFQTNLREMESKYPIRNKTLLLKSGIIMFFVILFFFLDSLPDIHLTLGWTALLGAIVLLVITDNENLEGVMGRVEWTTLLFFAALFVLMESLSRLGLIDWIGKQTEAIIVSVSEQNRLTVSILLVLWVSAIASAFIDNIPLTTMMIRIVTSLSKKPDLGLPLQPLVWALAFGACLGGNGTLIGSSSNVVGTGVAEQHGYKVTFVEFFKVGFPVMIVSISLISVYLLVAHVIFKWH